jgi:hypothetical protein
VATEPIEVRVRVIVEGPEGEPAPAGHNATVWAAWLCERIRDGDFDVCLEEILEAAHHRKREVRGHCR